MQTTLKHAFASFLVGFVLLSSIVSIGSAAQSGSVTELTNTDMQYQLHSDQFTLIDVGDNKVPILISLSEQPITKGVVLIIGDADMPLGRQDSLSHVAKYLPSIGWTTVVMPSLGLSLGSNMVVPIESSDTQTFNDTQKANTDNVTIAAAEQASKNLISEKTEDTVANSKNNSSAVSAVSEAALIVYSQEVETYLAAILTHMQTAATIAKLVSERDTLMQQIDALVINNPYWPIRKLNNKLPMIIAQTRIPVLDLVSQWDNSWSKQTERKRRIKARTELKEVYRQTDIIGQPLDQIQMQYIAREIKGWTTYLGW
jgi:cellobiose-specific phosphotransferase system component IIB